jgi:molecular chaperone GrpE
MNAARKADSASRRNSRPEQPGSPPEAETQAQNIENAAAPSEAQGQPNGGGPEDTEPTAQQLRDELEQIRDRALRAQAELENYRKRASRELQEQARYANIPLMRDLLPVIDNIDRAIEAAENAQEAPGLLAGFKMVAQQMQDVLRQHHCSPIDALHQPFDPNLHEAISQQPSPDLDPGTVMHVVQTGYKLHDRVVRPSQVVVSAAPPQPENPSGN